MTKLNFWVVLALLFFVSCNKDDRGQPSVESDVVKNVSIDLNKRHQIIDGFSASDCWTPNYVGKYWSAEEKESISNLLFSQEIEDKNPKGIGLSMWRFNLGGGTAIQGAESGIEDKKRRSDSFLQANGELDWSRHEGQQYFLDRAKQLGCESFVLFSNTPPVYYTKNGKGYSASGEYANLRDDKYDDFANYMTDVLKYFKDDKGVDFDFVSPVNEPQYNWNAPNQEGSGWQNSEISRLVKELDGSLTKKSLNTEILLSEAGSYEYLYKVKDSENRSDVIKELFHNASSNYIGNLAHVAPIIGGHGYWVDGSWSQLTSSRNALRTAATAAGLKVYQTEWSMLGDHFGDNYPGHDKATYMDIALYMSKVIHSDLVHANVCSWSYWTSMDVERWSHKNRFLLISLTPGDGAYGDIELSGTHVATKTLWVLGNYSRFIRPNYQRIDLDIANESQYFFGSAYQSPDAKRVVTVYTNYSNKPITVNLNIKNSNGELVSTKRYITNKAFDLAEQDVDGKTVIESQSVVTFVYTFK